MSLILDKNATLARYEDFRDIYTNLAIAVQQALGVFLKKEKIEVFDIAYRVKSFEAFWEKIERKDYRRPFSQIEDICGLRIVCYYPFDLERISRIITKEFNIRYSEDKSTLLEPDRFGYRSVHYIVVLKEGWLDAPQYRGLGNLKVEIQVRTILMHAWANLSHQLSYKKKEDVPDQFKRKIYQLSALFEIADQQFGQLQQEKIHLQKRLSRRTTKKSRFDTSQPMNVDTLQAFLDFYYPDRIKSIGTGRVLEGFMRARITFADLVNAYERTKAILPTVERDVFEKHLSTLQEMYPKRKSGKWWSQEGIADVPLLLANDRYWKLEQPHIPRDQVSQLKQGRDLLKEVEKR
jgi:ppGpp synthetase/RelA/SpoT-type nucleotidyltranferase